MCKVAPGLPAPRRPGSWGGSDAWGCAPSSPCGPGSGRRPGVIVLQLCAPGDWGGRRGGSGAREARARSLLGQAGHFGKLCESQGGGARSTRWAAQLCGGDAPSPGRDTTGRWSLERERGREGESFCLSVEGAAARTEAQVERQGLGGGCGGNICSELMRGEAAAAARVCEQGRWRPSFKGLLGRAACTGCWGWAVGFPSLPLKGRRSVPLFFRVVPNTFQVLESPCDTQNLSSL